MSTFKGLFLWIAVTTFWKKSKVTCQGILGKSDTIWIQPVSKHLEWIQNKCNHTPRLFHIWWLCILCYYLWLFFRFFLFTFVSCFFYCFFLLLWKKKRKRKKRIKRISSRLRILRQDHIITDATLRHWICVNARLQNFVAARFHMSWENLS